MSDTVEAVAKAIETALVSGSASVGDERMREIARAAIDAYEAAKKKAEEPYVTRVEKGVTYWSNGLCSQDRPKEINYSPDWVGETSIHTALDGTRYKATWLDFDKAGGPKLKIEKLP
jgi:hypothetical protein